MCFYFEHVRKECFIAALLFSGSLYADSIPQDVALLLSSDQFEDRELGQSRLMDLSLKEGSRMLPSLVELYKTSGRPELKARISGVMKDLVISERFGKGPGYVGIRMSDDKVPFDGRVLSSVQVMEVVAKSPADLAGLLVGDHVVRIDQLDFDKDRMAKVAPSLAFSNYVKTKRPGELAEVEVVRGGKRVVLNATLALMPKEILEQQRLMGFLREEAGEAEKALFYENWLKSQIEK